MLNYCIVKQRIGAITEDTTDDDDRYPDYTSVFGQIVFAPTMANGSAYKITDDDGVVHTVPATRITAQIVNGEILHEGRPGLPLFAAGPNANPSTIIYTATYTNLTAAGLPITLNNITFRAVPGETIDLSSYTPVAGAPTPGIIQGPPGYTPHIGENDNWWINRTDTGVAATSPLVHSYTELTGAFEENTMRVKALEAMSGVAPETPVDGQTANLIAQPDTLTRQVLRKNFAPGGGQQALPLTDVTLTPVEDSATPLSVIDGVAYGFTPEPDGFRMIVSSTDDGTTWNPVVRTPNTLLPRGLYPLNDGEVLLGIGSYVFKSTGWGTQVISWQTKITGSHGSSVFVPRTVSVYGDLVAAAEYGNRGTAPHAWLSQDSGNTWSKIVDLNEIYPPETRENVHVHTIVFDKYHPGSTPRLWMANGDLEVSRGMFYSDDLGETWVRISSSEQPTVFHPLPEGILIGTDDMEMAGMRIIDRDTMEVRQLWLSPDGPGLPQVALNSIEDEDTGIVYMSYRSSNRGTRGLILAYASGRAWPVWWDVEEQSDHLTFKGALTVHGVTAGGKIMAEVVHESGRKILWATKSRLGARDWETKPDSGNIAKSAGEATHTLALAVGFGAKAGPGAGAMAIGRNAKSPEFGGLALGEYAEAGNQATALGRTSKALGGLSVAIGPNSETVNHYALAIGTEAKATGPASSIAIGHKSSATGPGRPLAVGADSVSSGSSTVALGTQATASGGSSMAVGATSKALGNSANALGFGAQASEVLTVALGTTTQATGDGSTALGSESVSGGVGAIAAGRGATADGHGSVSVGRLATSSDTSSVAIGISATASANGGVALGGEASAAGGMASIAIGQRAKTTGPGRPIALGAEAIASGSSSLAVGPQATASGGSSVVLGGGASASGTFGTAIGFGAKVDTDHLNAVAIGSNTISTGSSQVAIGNRSLTMKNVSEGQAAVTDGALIYASGGNVRVRTADALASSQIITLRQGAAISNPTPEDLTTSITGILSYLRSNGFIAT